MDQRNLQLQNEISKVLYCAPDFVVSEIARKFCGRDFLIGMVIAGLEELITPYKEKNEMMITDILSDALKHINLIINQAEYEKSRTNAPNA